MSSYHCKPGFRQNISDCQYKQSEDILEATAITSQLMSCRVQFFSPTNQHSFPENLSYFELCINTQSSMANILLQLIH